MKKQLSFAFVLGLLGVFGFSSRAYAVEVSVERDANLPLVYFNLATKAGSVTDPKGQSGLTNFMGEMLLRGTKSHTKEQLDLAIDQLGAHLEVETRAEAMIFRGAVLATKLDQFLDIVTEMLTQPSFAEVEIKKLKSEVTSGILEELGHDGSLDARWFSKFLFREHPYGKPTLGTTQDINNLTQAELQAHYDRLIRDKLLLVVATGDTTVDRIQSWANSLSAARPGAGETLAQIGPPQNAPNRRLLIVDKPDRTQTQINAGQIGVRMTDKDFFPLYLGNHAFGGGSFSARLMVEIRVKRGWSYGAESHFRQGREPRSWQIHLFPAAKDTPAALAYTLGMVNDLQQKGLTLAEFEFAKRSLVNSSGFMYNTSKRRVENKLLERTLDLPDGFMKTYGPELEKVTLDQVNSSLRTFLKPEKFAITIVATAKNLKIPLAKAAGMSEDQVQVVPYTQEDE